jgi:DivIVA domain-containing protein
VTDLRPEQFSTTRLRPGYDPDEVDAFLEAIRETLLGIREPFLTSDDVRNKQFSFTRLRPGYDQEEVDALLDEVELRLAASPPGQSQDNEPEPDAYRLPIQDRPAGSRTYLRTRTSRRALRERYAEECWKAWNEFGQQPGTYLRLEWVKIACRELRSAEQQPIASIIYRWYDPILGNANISEIGGRFSINKESFVLKSTGYAQSRKLVDKTGTPILYTSGMNFERRAKASVSFPDGRSLRFPVRGTHRANAIMTAVNEAGNSVARYRIIRFSTGGLGRKSVEVAVHPDFELTNELMLAIMTSAPQLRSYFSVQSGGGG